MGEKQDLGEVVRPRARGGEAGGEEVAGAWVGRVKEEVFRGLDRRVGSRNEEVRRG